MVSKPCICYKILSSQNKTQLIYLLFHSLHLKIFSHYFSIVTFSYYCISSCIIYTIISHSFIIFSSSCVKVGTYTYTMSGVPGNIPFLKCITLSSSYIDICKRLQFLFLPSIPFHFLFLRFLPIISISFICISFFRFSNFPECNKVFASHTRSFLFPRRSEWKVLIPENLTKEETS